MNTPIEHVLPVEIVCAMVNSDLTGCSDADIEEIALYEQDLLNDGYSAIPAVVSFYSEFYSSNDFNNLGGDCIKCLFFKINA